MVFLGETAALATSCLWSVASVAHTAVGKKLGAMQLNLVRLPVALLLLGAGLIASGLPAQVRADDALWLLASGVIGLAVGDTFLYMSMILIGPRISILIYSTAPAMTALLAWPLLDESLGLMAVWGIALTTLGVVFVTAERLPDGANAAGEHARRGLAWAVLATFFQSIGMIVAKQGLEHGLDPLAGTVIRMAGATAVVWGGAILSGRAKNPARLVAAHPGLWKMVLLGALCGPALGVWTMLVALKYTSTGIAATLIATEPVTLLPVLYLTEGYRASARALLGALVVVAGASCIFLR